MSYGWEIRQDYSCGLGWGYRRRRWRRRLRWLAVVLCAGLLSAAAFLWQHLPVGGEAIARQAGATAAAPMALELPAGPPAAGPGQSNAHPFEPAVGREAPGKADTAAGTAPEPAVPGQWHEVTVRSGDNMSLIFSRLGLTAGELHRILQAGSESDRLKRLRPGQQVRLRVEDGVVHELVLEEDLFTSLEVVKTASGYRVDVSVTEPDRRVTGAVGRIDSSLFVAGQEAGLSDTLIMQLVEVFGWDIDFVLDVRAGDRFAVVYEEYYKEGEKVRDGELLAAEFLNRGRTLRAVRYRPADDSPAYYSDEGASMRKAFLRTPVRFSRISSRFNLRRKHPVLNRIRAHKGVDYAAPHGTPIKATGTGKVVFAGRNGGYGNVVEIKHGGIYSTLYAHMSRYARGVRAGQRVRQGQTIGYVGQSGLATGPHLHYEFRVNGVHRDPLTVPLPKAEPLPAGHMPDFREKTAPLIAELERLSNTTVSGGSVASNP